MKWIQSLWKHWKTRLKWFNGTSNTSYPVPLYEVKMCAVDDSGETYIFYVASANHSQAGLGNPHLSSYSARKACNDHYRKNFPV